jgi:hypothetical protein
MLKSGKLKGNLGDDRKMSKFGQFAVEIRQIKGKLRWMIEKCQNLEYLPCISCQI